MSRRKDGIEIPLNESTHTLGLDEIVIHRIRAQTKRAEENAALHFGAETLAPGICVEIAIWLAVTIRSFGARAVSDTVVFGEI
jgi:hypothetical protein